MHHFILELEKYGIGFSVGVFLMLVISFFRSND